MRIGIISHLKFPIAEPFAGGLEMHTSQLAAKLTERGHDVRVYCSEGSDVAGALHVCPPTAEFSESVIGAIEHRAYQRIMNDIDARQFDIVHNNSLHYVPLAADASLATPVVTALHTPPFEPLAPAVNEAYERGHQFISVSAALTQLWSELCDVQNTVPNGIDLSRFYFKAEPRDPLYVVWYGRIVPEKGLHFAIDAARYLGIPIRFAGPILDQNYYSDKIACRIGSNTTYEGHLNHSSLSHLIGSASAFLCTPCWDEPFGLVVAEALACGVPVAAFARGGIPSILDSSSGVLALPDDSQSLADAAVRAMGLSRHACRLRAEKVCDIELMIDSYIDVYACLAGKTPQIALPSVRDGFEPQTG